MATVRGQVQEAEAGLVSDRESGLAAEEERLMREERQWQPGFIGGVPRAAVGVVLVVVCVMALKLLVGSPGTLPDASANMESIVGFLGLPGAFTCTGKVSFDGSPNIKPGSVLTVKLQDTSKLDAPATTLAKSVQTIQHYKSGDTIDYKMSPCLGQGELSVSAFLNVGWKRTGNEWIRHGDWLNDVTFPVTIPQNPRGHEDLGDIKLVKYG